MPNSPVTGWQLSTPVKLDRIAEFSAVTKLAENTFNAELVGKKMGQFEEYWQHHYASGENRGPIKFTIKTERSLFATDFLVEPNLKTYSFDKKFAEQISNLVSVKLLIHYTREQKESCLKAIQEYFFATMPQIEAAISSHKIPLPDPSNIESCLELIEREAIFEKIITCPNCNEYKFVCKVDDWQRKNYKWEPYKLRCSWCSILFLEEDVEKEKGLHRARSYARPFCDECHSNKHMKRLSEEHFFSWECGHCNSQKELSVFKFQKQILDQESSESSHHSDNFDDIDDDYDDDDYDFNNMMDWSGTFYLSDYVGKGRFNPHDGEYYPEY